MTDEKAFQTEKIIQNWHILFRQDMRCFARSDNGIDYNGEYMRRKMSIPPEAVVFRGAEPVGVSLGEHLFIFDDPETHTFTVMEPEKYVSGWGDVTETFHYTLTPGPAPEGSFPACLQS